MTINNTRDETELLILSMLKIFHFTTRTLGFRMLLHPSHIVGLFHYQKCCEEKHDKNSPEMRLQFISFYHLQFAQTLGRHVCTSSFPFISSDGSYFIAKNIDEKMKLGK